MHSVPTLSPEPHLGAPEPPLRPAPPSQGSTTPLGALLARGAVQSVNRGRIPCTTHHPADHMSPVDRTAAGCQDVTGCRRRATRRGARHSQTTAMPPPVPCQCPLTAEALARRSQSGARSPHMAGAFSDATLLWSLPFC